MADKIQIVSRWDSAKVLFECDAPEKLESGLHMRHALENAVEARANLAHANLAGADLARAYLVGADLAGADLAGAYLARADLVGANLAGADLAGASLARADLAGADLAGANLAHANLAGASLARAYLVGADLARAYLARAYLVGADLAGADLAGAYLARAKLRDDLTLVGKRPFFAIGPIGSRSDSLLIFLTDKGVYLRAGCFFGTRDEFIAALDKEHGDNEHGQEYRAALALVDVHANLWGAA